MSKVFFFSKARSFDCVSSMMVNTHCVLKVNSLTRDLLMKKKEWKKRKGENVADEVEEDKKGAFWGSLWNWTHCSCLLFTPAAWPLRTRTFFPLEPSPWQPFWHNCVFSVHLEQAVAARNDVDYHLNSVGDDDLDLLLAEGWFPDIAKRGTLQHSLMLVKETYSVYFGRERI